MVPHSHVVPNENVWPLLCALVFLETTAYATSSNYNNPTGFASGFDPIQRALKMIQSDDGGTYSELERDLIEAMAARSSAESKAAVDITKMAFGSVGPQFVASFQHSCFQFSRSRWIGERSINRCLNLL